MHIRLFVCSIVLLIILLVLVGLAPLPAFAQGPSATPRPAATATLSAEAILAEAQRLVADAQRENESATHYVDAVNTMLNFLNVAGLVVTAVAVPLVAFGVAVGLRTVGQYRREVDRVQNESAQLGKQLNAARLELEQAQVALTKMRVELLEQVEQRIASLAQLEANINQKLEEMLKYGDDNTLSLTLLQLGRQQTTARNLETALQIFQDAHDLAPDSPAANYFLGDAYIRLLEPDKGIEHLNRAQMGGKEYLPTEAALAYALRMKGDREQDPNKRNRYYAQAEERFLKILDRNPRLLDINGEAMVGSLAGLYRREGRIRDAIRCYELAHDVTPESSYPVGKLSLLYAIQGDAATAKRYFERTVSLATRNLDGDPFDSWARFDMVTALVALGRTEEAFKALAPAMDYAFDMRPLERFLSSLNDLRKLPQPPADLDKVIGQATQMLEDSQRAAQRETEALAPFSGDDIRP